MRIGRPNKKSTGIFSKFHMDEKFQKLNDRIYRELKMMKNDTNMTWRL